MLIVHVQVRVKPGREEEFRLATVANARESLKEPGIARFDVVQAADDPTHFVLVEAYRSDDAPAALDPAQAARRELLEEAGVVGEPVRLVSLRVTPMITGTTSTEARASQQSSANMAIRMPPRDSTPASRVVTFWDTA